MIYDQSAQIQQRLSDALRLVQAGRYSAPGLARELHVSIPTVSRCIEALRARGHPILAVKAGRSWRYILNTTRRDGGHRARLAPAAGGSR